MEMARDLLELSAMPCIYRGALVLTPVVDWSTTAAEAPTLHDGSGLIALEVDETDRQAARGVEVVEWFADLVERAPSHRPPPMVSDVVPARSRAEADEADTEPRLSDEFIREARALGLI